MKRYAVEMDSDASREAIEAAFYISQFSPINAQRWYEGLHEAIESLKRMPNRCALARENQFLRGRELRQYIYKSYRIIFHVNDTARVVRILHIRHSARRAIGESDEE